MAWGSSGRRRTEAHEKSMGSYEQHAYSDACSMAQLLDDEVGAVKARKIFESIGEENLRKYEEQASDLIEDFIKRTESQRPSVLKKLADERTRVAFIALAILGCLRAREVMELRDQYRMALAPGCGNRVTTAALYGFAEGMRSLFTYAWPYETFDTIGLYDDGSEDAEDDQE